jgi:hypothetical protein
LSVAAKELETAIVQGNSALYAGNLELVEQELTSTMAALASLAPSAPDDTRTRSLEELGPQLNQLARLLAANDAQAIVFMGNLLQQTHETGLEAEFKGLERLIRRYDFENALKELELIAQKLQIALPKKK